MISKFWLSSYRLLLCAIFKCNMSPPLFRSKYCSIPFENNPFISIRKLIKFNISHIILLLLLIITPKSSKKEKRNSIILPRFRGKHNQKSDNRWNGELVRCYTLPIKWWNLCSIYVVSSSLSRVMYLLCFPHHQILSVFTQQSNAIYIYICNFRMNHHQSINKYTSFGYRV